MCTHALVCVAPVLWFTSGPLAQAELSNPIGIGDRIQLSYGRTTGDAAEIEAVGDSVWLFWFLHFQL
jgi:hypothetical protein